MSENAFEVLMSAGDGVEEDGLLWRPILREVECQYMPTAAGPVKKPFKVIKEGESDLLSGIISMSDVFDAFQDEAFEHVQVPLASKKKVMDPITGASEGGDHEAITRNNQGFVKKLRIDDSDGGAVLMAGMEITEPDTLEKMNRGTYASSSAGIKEHINKHTGKHYRAALHHSAITNEAWVPGLSAALSDEGESVVNIDAADDEIDVADVVWREEDSAGWVRDRVQAALSKLTESAPQLAERVFFWVKDVAPVQGTAFVVKDGPESGGESYVVPYSMDGDDVQLAPGPRWTQTRSVMVAASDMQEDQLRQRVQNALHYGLNLGTDYEVVKVEGDDAIVENKVAGGRWQVGWDLADEQIWLDPTDEWRRKVDDEGAEREQREAPRVTRQPAVVSLSDEETRAGLRAAQEERASRAGKNNQEVTRNMSNLNLEGLDLSDEQRQELERRTTEVTLSDEERTELQRRRTKDRERAVEDKIKELGEIGLSANPGVLKYLRRVYLSDDSKPAAVLLSDEEHDDEVEVTLSEAFDGLFLLLKNQESGKIELSSAGLTDGPRPTDTAEEEVEQRSVDQQLQDAADKLGLRVRKSRTSRKEAS